MNFSWDTAFVSLDQEQREPVHFLITRSENLDLEASTADCRENIDSHAFHARPRQKRGFARSTGSGLWSCYCGTWAAIRPTNPALIQSQEESLVIPGKEDLLFELEQFVLNVHRPRFALKWLSIDVGDENKAQTESERNEHP